MNDEERIWLLVHELERILFQEGPSGIKRYEKMFKMLGFRAGLNTEAVRHLSELYCMRNLFVHQRGVADRRFLEVCPWLRKTVGDIIVLTDQEFSRYWDASSQYLKHLKSLTGHDACGGCPKW